MTVRGRPREFDRNQALKKAMEVFWIYGYEGASLAELKKAMKITSPSLYAAFGNKEQLFIESVELYLKDSTTAKALLEEPTAKKSVDSILRSAAESFANRKTPPGCLVVLGTMNCTTESRSVQIHLMNLRLQTEKNIKKRLDQGIEKGELPKNAPTSSMASFYTTVLHGLSIQSRDGASKNTLLAVVDGAMGAWDGFIKAAGR